MKTSIKRAPTALAGTNEFPFSLEDMSESNGKRNMSGWRFVKNGDIGVDISIEIAIAVFKFTEARWGRKKEKKNLKIKL